jgi:hypothetical protein
MMQFPETVRKSRTQMALIAVTKLRSGSGTRETVQHFKLRKGTVPYA